MESPDSVDSCPDEKKSNSHALNAINEFDLSSQLSILNIMSQEEALDLRKTNRHSDGETTRFSFKSLGSEERDLLKKAHQLLEKCLKLHKGPEKVERLVVQRTVAFMALYSQKAGKSFLKEAVSSAKTFLDFLVFIIDMVKCIAPGATKENNILLSRSPNPKLRFQPYGVPSGGQPCHSKRDSAVRKECKTSSITAPVTADFDFSNSASGDSLDDEDLKVSLDNVPPEFWIDLTDIFGRYASFPDLDVKDIEEVLNSSPTVLDDCNSLMNEIYQSNSLGEMSPTGFLATSPSCSLSPLNPSDSPTCTSIPNLSPPQYGANRSWSISPAVSPAALTVQSGGWSSLMDQQLSSMNIYSPGSADSDSNAKKGSNVAAPVIPSSLSKVEPNAESAKEELLSRISTSDRERSVRKFAEYSDAEIFRRSSQMDEDGDTALMMAYANKTVTLAEVFILTERLKPYPKLFQDCNRSRKNALCFAVTDRKDEPYLAGYLAETMVSLNLPLDQPLYRGNTIVHVICQNGDSHAQVLRYILRVKNPQGKMACKLNNPNHDGRTPLHEAVIRQSLKVSCYEIIKLLLKYGADAGLKETTSGRTPVHYAVEKRDYEILHELLVSCPESANAPGCNDNTPLHTAAALREGISEEEQLTMVIFLMNFGADKTRRNKANKLPIELVPSRRHRVKEALMARQRN